MIPSLPFCWGTFFKKTSSVAAFFLRKSLVYFTGDTDENKSCLKYEAWNFNSGNYLFTTDTK